MIVRIFMRERIVIVFIAVALGLIVTTLAFLLYQQTKTLPKTTKIVTNPSPTPKSGPYLVVDTPTNESLSDRRTIQVKGKTNSLNLVIISTNQEDVAVKATPDGKFAATITIDAGSNRLVTHSISPDGESTEDSRIITFSTEEF